MRHIELNDLSDPGLDVYARLTEPQLRSRLEPGRGVFIAESPKVIRAALAAGCRPLSLLMERRWLQNAGQNGMAELLARCGDVPVYTGPRALLAGLTGYALTRGVLCAMRRPAPRTVRQVCAGARRVAVLENITDAANVGALFRSAAALGMDAMLLSPGCCDPLCRRAVRVSMGAVLALPWARLGQTAQSWPQPALAQLQDQGFALAALALRADAVTPRDAALHAEPRLALLLGTEGEGLLPQTIAACRYTVRIPMRRGIDSLNVAAAGAVAFWELAQ